LDNTLAQLAGTADNKFPFDGVEERAEQRALVAPFAPLAERRVEAVRENPRAAVGVDLPEVGDLERAFIPRLKN
jgi:hypothetical protein